jgi:uncharacterized membrane protein
MHPSRIELFYWAAGLFVHAALLVVLWTRHRAKTFPFFTTLITANIVRSLTLYAVFHYGTKTAYLVSYMAFATLDFVLQVSVAYELASHVFCPTGTWAPDVRKPFIMLVIIGVVIAAGLACMPTPPEKTLLKALLDRANLFSSALLCILFVGMIRFSVTARLPWKTHEARIAQGLGLYSLLGILIAAGYTITGEVRTSMLSQQLTLLRLTTYLVCVTYWTVMLWRDAPAPKELPDEVRRQLFTLQTRVEYDLRKLRALKR